MTLYPHAGVAIAFSPRLDALLAEAAPRLRYLAREITLIHVGAPSAKKELMLKESLRKAGLDEQMPIHWGRGTPHTAIIDAIRTREIDLLLLGALERERPIRYYMGSVAHNLVREAPCSLMLFTAPRKVPERMSRITVVTDYSESALIALTRAQRLAEREGADRLFVLRVLPKYGEAMAMADGFGRQEAVVYQQSTIQEEGSLLQDFVDAAGHVEVPVEPHVVEGHPGPTVAHFVREHQVELLAMPSSVGFGHIFERLFPSGMEWLLREIPCNLWVIRERLTSG